MESTKALVGTALLNVYWKTRRKDLLDLITPFINYCTAQVVTPEKSPCKKNQISLGTVTEKVRKEFGYVDIPAAIVEKIYKRDQKHYCKNGGNYYLIEPFDDLVERMDKKRLECAEMVDNLGKSLLCYLKSHCQKEKVYTKEQVIEKLQKFFIYYGTNVTSDDLDFRELTPASKEIYYWIGRYIDEEKDKESREYVYLYQLINGYYLQAAIYMQPDTDTNQKKAFQKVSFCYDTPFLIDLLDFQDKEAHQAAEELHQMLQKQGGQAYYFPQMKEELIGILYAYQLSIGVKQGGTGRTLQALDEKRYTSNDVHDLIARLPSLLEKHHVFEKDLPQFPQREDGTVDERYVIDEEEAKRFVAEHTAHYAEKNLDNDIKSAIAIHKLRGSLGYSRIEDCGHILVTNNYDLTRVFNRYYKEKVSSEAYGPIIDTKTLAALAWVRSGGGGTRMAELELLQNAFMAMQPIPEMKKRFIEEIEKLVSFGKVTEDEALILRTDQFLGRELNEKMGFDPANINEESTYKLVKDAKERVVAGERAAAERKQAQRQAELKQKARKEAEDTAQAEKQKFIRRWTFVTKVLTRALLCVGIGGCIASFLSGPIGIVSLIASFFSAWGIWDTVFSKKSRIQAKIEKLGNKKEKETFDKEYMKLMELIETQQE